MVGNEFVVTFSFLRVTNMRIVFVFKEVLTLVNPLLIKQSLAVRKGTAGAEIRKRERCWGGGRGTGGC